MNFKTTYFLFGLLALLFLALAISLFLTPPEPARAGFLFPSMHVESTKVETDAVEKITIQRKSPSGSDIVLEKDGKAWRITSPRTMAADRSAVDSLLFNLRGAKFDAEAKPVSWRDAGLSDPSRIITLEAGDRKFVVKVGLVTEGENTPVYVESSERPGKALPVRKGDIRTALEDLAHFRGKELIADAPDVTRLKLSQGKKTPLELKRDKGVWSFVTPAYGEAEGADLVSALNGLSVHHVDDKTTDFVADETKDLAKYHLDAKSEPLRIEAWHEDKATAVIVGVSKKEGDKFFAAVDAPDAKTHDVVKLSAASVEKFTKLLDDPGSLRNKNLVKLVGSPDAIDVNNAYGLLEFRHADPIKDWELYRGTSASKVDPLEVRKLIDGLNKKDQVTAFPDPAKRKEMGIDREDAIVVKVWADSLEKPDEKKPGKPAFKKDVKPAAELRFGTIQGDSVAVLRTWGNDSTLVLVPKELLTTVQQRPQDYFDKNLSPFNPGSAEENVTKVEITQGGTTTEVAREKATGPWKITKPETMKGRTANEEVVRSLLGELNRITVREIVAEKVDPKDLGREYDLEKPPVRVAVTVTKDGKDTKHEFDFGKEKAGKGVYMKRGDNAAVYVVEASLPAGAKKDLRDPTVLSFDPEKVASVTFKGWQKVVGSVLTRKVEKKGSTWESADKDFKLDPDKVENLVRSISRLQAERFVPAAKGTAFAEGGFEVEVTLTDKKVLTLTVGAEEGASAYAQSSELKGEAVMVRADLFTAARAAPAYFSK